MLVTLLIFFTSCSDDLPIDDAPRGDYENGYFVVNEGPFGAGTGTLTFIDDDEEVSQNVYTAVNPDMELGNIAQSMHFYNNTAFIVINNSHKIIVVNRYTMENITTIEGDEIKNPRYFVAIGNTGYVSNWGSTTNPNDDFITIINLDTNTITGTISVGEGPEDMLVKGSKIYVNLQGGHSQNNKVEVIDTTTNTVSSTINVGDVPNSIIKDNTGAIWILCGGKPSWTGSETNGKLIKIVNDDVATTLNFGATEHPEHLSIDGDNLYYNLSGKVRKNAVSATVLNTDDIAGLDGFYYAMKVHDGSLYTTNAGNFTSEGTLSVFDLNTNTLSYSKTTGIIPTFIAFQ